MNITHVFWKQLQRQKWEKKVFFSTSKKNCAFLGYSELPFWAPSLATCHANPAARHLPSFPPQQQVSQLPCCELPSAWFSPTGSVCRGKSLSSTTLIDYLVSFKVNFGTHWCRFWLLSRIHPSCTQITTVWKHTELQAPSPEGWDLLVSNRRGSFSNCVGFFALRAGAHRATCRAEKWWFIAWEK